MTAILHRGLRNDFFFSPIYFFQFLFGLFFPFSIWTFFFPLNSFFIRFKFVSNSFQIHFKFVLNSFQIRFKFVFIQSRSHFGFLPNFFISILFEFYPYFSSMCKVETICHLSFWIQNMCFQDWVGWCDAWLAEPRWRNRG